MSAFYFGCWQRVGHHFFTPGMRSAGGYAHVAEQLPFERIDGALCPETNRRLPHEQQQPEGVARVTYKGGWTALAFWDRSVDSRHGSNSTFLLEGEYDFDAAVAEARAQFPQVFARYDFAVVPEHIKEHAA